jgi:membrane-associated protease RseP (regulator of RpoE activity)
MSRSLRLTDWRTPILLFALTAATTTLAGAAYSGAGLSQWWRGLPFSVPLLAILLTHELGHYLAARRHGVDVSPPYFIPLPPMLGIGTLGAVIRIREPIASRNALMQIGAAGPLSGFVVALGVLIVGIHLSPVETLAPANASGLLTEGNSVLYAGLKFLVHGEFLPGANRDLMMHPMAFAGWIGLFITMINLIPVGQLDGGHVAFAWAGDRYRRSSGRVHALLPLFGLVVFTWVFLDELAVLRDRALAMALEGGGTVGAVAWDEALTTGFGAAMPWFMWPFLLWLLQRLSGGDAHPPVGEDLLTPASRRAAWAVALLFLLIFMPVPMRVSS